MRRLITLLLFVLLVLVMVWASSCTPYPGQARVVKQDTHRYNPKTGR